MSVMMVQTKCKLDNTESFLKLFHIQSKLETASSTKKQQILKNGKVRFCLNIDVRTTAIQQQLLLQFTVTREMLTAVAGISTRYSKFAFVLFCYITNHLMTGPLGNSEFCFPRISMFPETKSRETLRFSGNKIHCSPRDQSLSVYCYIAGVSPATAHPLIG